MPRKAALLLKPWAFLSLSYLYPTAKGGIQAEWSLGDWKVSLEIDLAGQIAEWQALNLKTQACRDDNLSLAKPEDWQKLNQNLQELLLENT